MDPKITKKVSFPVLVIEENEICLPLSLGKIKNSRKIIFISEIITYRELNK